MDEFINKQDAENTAYYVLKRNCCYYPMRELVKALDNLPTVDIPKIIRCKDCKHLVQEVVEEFTNDGFSEPHTHYYCSTLLQLKDDRI